MLQSIRRRQGPMLIFILILLIVSFVFMTDYGAGTFNIGSTLFKIDDTKIDAEEALQFAHEKLGLGGIQPDIDRLNALIEEEMNRETRDEKKISSLRETFQENNRKIATTAAHMALDRVMEADGVKVNEAMALDALRKNRYMAYQVFQRHIGAFEKGEPLPPEARLALKRFIFNYTQQLHSRLYSACLAAPASLSYAGFETKEGQGFEGWSRSALAAEVTLLRLPLSAFNALKVTGDGSETTSADAAALEAFYNDYKRGEPRDGRPGYTLPADIDVICLYAASADHVAQVKTNPVVLRQHYESHKDLWLAPLPAAPVGLGGATLDAATSDAPVALPFMEVRPSVERHYRWTQAEMAARKVLEAARFDWRSGKDFSDILRLHKVKYVSFDGLKRREVDDLPAFRGARGLEQAFRAEPGAFSERVDSFEEGPYIWRVTAKKQEEVLDLESHRPQVQRDIRRIAQLEAAGNTLVAYAKAYDVAQGDSGKALAALQAEGSRVLGGIAFTATPSEKPLGLIRSGDTLDEMTGHEAMVENLFRNLSQGKGLTSDVNVDTLSHDALLLVSTSHKLMTTDTKGRSFPEFYKNSSVEVLESIARDFWGNPWLTLLYEQRVRMLTGLN